PRLTELVEGLAREVRGELREFPARHLSLGGRLAQRPEEPHDLGPADAADAGERPDRPTIPPALTCIIARPPSYEFPVLPAGLDHIAERGAGRVGPELAPDRGHAHLLQKGPALLQVSPCDQDLPSAHQRPSLEVWVVGARCDRHTPLDVLQGVVELPAVPRELRVG